LIDLFQKVAVSKDGVFGRAPQSAKSPFAVFFLRDLPAKQGNVQLFFFGGMLDPKEKAGEQK
jgi:hypothetical protein